MMYPSNAHMWGPGRCPASPHMQSRQPRPPKSPSQREGDAAHWTLSKLLNGGEVKVGDVADNGVVIDSELLGHAGDAALEISHFRGEGVDVYVEQSFPVPYVREGMNARPDVLALAPSVKTAGFFDFKYGHREVETYHNPQFIVEAACLFSMDIPDIDEWEIYFTVIQPRCYTTDPVRSWLITGAELRTEVIRYRDAAELASRENAPTKSGTYCRDCHASHSCRAIGIAAALAIDVSDHMGVTPLTPESAGLELTVLDDAEKRLAARRAGIEAYLMQHLSSGGRVDGWNIEQKMSNLKWTRSDAEVALLGAAFNLDLHKPAELITPTQAKKLGISDDVIASYSGREAGKLTLKRASNLKAERAFK